MAVVYVKEQGAYVKKVDKHIVVEKKGKRLSELVLSNITNLCVIGNVQVTTQVIHLLMEEKIDISYFSYNGNFIGQMAADTSKNIFLRFAQYDLYQNMDERLRMARIIVANKIGNQIQVIHHHNWKGIEYDYRDEIVQLNKQLETLAEKQTTNEIMGVEGICSAIYFTSFAHMFRCDIKFNGRNRRPPKDPINVILSLAYTLLTKEVSSVLDAESFENYLGILHGIRYGRKSLALDIVEEFRQPVVDRLVIRLFNKQMLSSFDFEMEDEKIVLTEDGFRKFISYYEKWMKQPICATDTRNFRSVIRSQVSQLKQAIKSHGNYIPYAWKGEVDDADSKL